MLRDYKNCNEDVKENYRIARNIQNPEFVKYMRMRFSKSTFFLTFHQITDALNNFVDLSDPDMELPNLQHAFQSAEKALTDGKSDWFVLSLFIHDFGKLLFLQNEPKYGISLRKQWATVGDTFITGCAFPKQILFPEFNPKNNLSKYGIYKPHCGLQRTFVSYGHDEYLYQVLSNPVNKNLLPPEALYCIRFHSLYLHHQDNEYEHLLDDYDKAMLPLLQEFNKYDLYSKTEKIYDISNNKYQILWNMFFEKNGLYL